MKFRLAFAIFLSIILIGVAAFNRFGYKPEPKQAELGIERAPVNTYSPEDLVKNFIQPTVATSTTEPALELPLTNTDIITRNLLTEYLELEASGNPVDQGSLSYIAKKYSGELLGLHSYVRATALDIKVVSDDGATATQYAVSVSSIYTEYAEKMKAAVEGLNTEDANYVPRTNALALIYQWMEKSLENTPVPKSLAEQHLVLVNYYRSNVSAMRSVATLEQDPLTTLAGLTAINDGAVNESTALKQIDQILQDKWGII